MVLTVELGRIEDSYKDREKLIYCLFVCLFFSVFVLFLFVFVLFCFVLTFFVFFFTEMKSSLNCCHCTIFTQPVCRFMLGECLSNPDKCTAGLTFGVRFKLDDAARTYRDEPHYIVDSGGSNKGSRGFTLFVKDGKLYAVVSVPDEVWRVRYGIIFILFIFYLIVTWLPQVRKWSGKTFQGQGKVSEVYFESGKIEILKKSQGKLKL